MPDSIVATIQKVEPLKSGENNGRKWVLYKVTAGGQTYTTFDADWQKAVGQERTIEYTESKNGAYTNRRIVDPKPQRRGNPAIDRIEAKLDEVLAILKAR